MREHVWPLVRRRLPLVVGLLLTVLASTALTTAVPLLIKYAIDDGLREHDEHALGVAVLVLLGLAALKPVVATTTGTRYCTHAGSTAIVPSGVEKSMSTSSFRSGVRAWPTGTPILPRPQTSPASRPWQGWEAASRAAPRVRCGSSRARATSRCPMRPQAPLMPTTVFMVGSRGPLL